MTTNGIEPKVLTVEQREAALVSNRAGTPQMEETKKLAAGETLFRPGDYYDRQRSNQTSRAQAHGLRAHVRKAVVDGDAGYLVWWDRGSDEHNR